MMWYWGSGMHWLGWGIGAFTTLIFWGLVIWAIVAFVRWFRGARPGPLHHGTWHHGDDSEQILARRFAAGEIDAGEYRERLDALRDGQPAAAEDRR